LIMEVKVIYENHNLLAIEKPAGITVFSEKPVPKKTFIDFLLEQFPHLKECEPPRYGMVHRLDKETSGVLLVAKNEKALSFFQEQFKEKKIVKKYLALVYGKLKVKKGRIDTLLGRSPSNRLKQKVFFPFEPKAEGKRRAVTDYSVLGYYKGRGSDYTLVEFTPKTGRKHQIRVHIMSLGHPIVGDKLYSFKDKKNSEDLGRQFLHSSFLGIELFDGSKKAIESALPKDLKEFLKRLEKIQ